MEAPDSLGGLMAPSAAAPATIPTYQSALELFEATRDAALDRVKTMRKLEKLEGRKSSEAVRSQSYEATGRGGGADPTSRIDDRLDLEEIYRRRLSEDNALIELAGMLIYGRERHKGGVEKLVSPDHADVLNFYYRKAETWPSVADMVGMSATWCKLAARTAIDQVDAYGVGRMLAGTGMAS